MFIAFAMEKPNPKQIAMATGQVRVDAQTVLFKWHDKEAVPTEESLQKYGVVQLAKTGISDFDSFDKLNM